MADRVKQALFRRILSGELAPGARLVELQIAREMNTSQGPVREALRELEALQIVVTEPYRGSYVRHVSDQDTLEAYQTRGALERLAGQLAAPFLKGRTQDLRKEAEAIRSAARRNHAEDYAIHDMNFHRRIVEESRNRILLRTWDALSFEIRIRLWLAQGRVDLNAAEADHWPIIDALDRGDGKKAGRLLRQHLMFAIADVKGAVGHPAETEAAR
ncbi:MAG TPA: GntR family transcriptional regulator [Bryobacteraceae bacterium]|nr:GntR family transcriptional regulator [Bryobacteraceae bacterium]